MNKKCPFCHADLIKSNSFQYYECNTCISQYTEYITGDSATQYVEHVIYKTPKHSVSTIDNKNHSYTRITNSFTKEVIFKVNQIIDIKNLTLDQIDNKILKLALYK